MTPAHRRFALYLVVPRRRRDGFNLFGPKLGYGRLWYQCDISAVSYALWHMRDTGGSVTIIDSKGFPVITESVAVPDGAQTQYGPQVSWPAGLRTEDQ